MSFENCRLRHAKRIAWGRLVRYERTKDSISTAANRSESQTKEVLRRRETFNIL